MKGADEIIFIERICRDETSFCSDKYVPRLPISLEEKMKNIIEVNYRVNFTQKKRKEENHR